MLTKHSENSWALKTTIIFVVAVIVLVAVANRESVTSAVEKAEFVAHDSGINHEDNCVEKIQTLVRGDCPATFLKKKDKLAWSNGAVLAYESKDGEVVTVPFEKTLAFEQILTKSDWQRLLSNPTRQHKFIKNGDKLLFVYDDNFVLSANAKTCEMDGVYFPMKNGEHHPLVADDATDSLAVTQDCQKSWRCICRYTGASGKGESCNTSDRSDAECLKFCERRWGHLGGKMEKRHCDSCAWNCYGSCSR